ncbi:MAG: OmpA family protein [Desulfuromonadaceae bacterium]|nr:OmpA family protein [Desulfuromonadaceae bacterium]
MKKVLRGSLFLAAAISAASLFGCANYEVNTNRGNIPGKYIRYEMQESDRAVEAARMAGKDKMCPAEFKAAEDAKNNAYDVFRSCRTEEGAALAKKATEKANALCPPRAVEKAPAPAPVPAPAPAPAPPADSDHDGVIDALDKCPGTPAGVAVDGNGCPIDSDKDGVADYLDKCPGTPAGTAVNASGCPLEAAKKFCDKPVVIPILFDFGKSEIKAKYYDELDTIGKFLKEFPNSKGTIDGHTDSVGGPKFNQKLSLARAEKIHSYLIKKFGIEGSRITAKGHGETKPVASNKDSAGRAKNRRIETAFSCE